MDKSSLPKRPRKAGSGRKKGSKSFTRMTFSELSKICGSETIVPVSRVWLEQMGIKVTEDAEKQIDEAKESQPSIQYKIHE